MLRVKFDTKQINKILNNTVSYSYGFLQGIDMTQITFNELLGEYTVDALNKYIDSQAKADPDAFHHIYEWNAVGNETERLFVIKPKASKNVINFTGFFLQSKTLNENSNTPFSDKAEIMENQISITVAPKNSDFLVFEDQGELVFTSSAVHIEHPGGDAVAGSFGKVVDEFFLSYFTNSLIAPLLEDLSRADEFTNFFPQGAKSGGKMTGIKAGKKYLNIKSLGAIE